VEARNRNGAVQLTLARGAACSKVTLSTSFAPMSLTVPDGMGMVLSATTSFGTIRSDLPITTTGVLGKDSLQGTVGAGGCVVSLTNANGNVEIRKAP
jgi:hypothetical protein